MKILIAILLMMSFVVGCNSSSGGNDGPPKGGGPNNPEKPVNPEKPIVEVKWKWLASNLLEYPFPDRSSFGESVYDENTKTAYIVGGIGMIDKGGGIYLFSKKDLEKKWSDPKGIVRTPYMRWGMSNFDQIHLAVDAKSNLYLQYHELNVATRSYVLKVLRSEDSGTTWQTFANALDGEINSFWIEKMHVLPSGDLIFVGNRNYNDGAIFKLSSGNFSTVKQWQGSSRLDFKISSDGGFFALSRLDGKTVISESRDGGSSWTQSQLPMELLNSVLLISDSLDLFVAGAEIDNTLKCGNLNIYQAKKSNGPWVKIGSLKNQTTDCFMPNVVSGTINRLGHIHFLGSLGTPNNNTNRIFIYSSGDMGKTWSSHEKQYSDYKSVSPKQILANDLGFVMAGANTSPGGNVVNDYFGLLTFGFLDKISL